MSIGTDRFASSGHFATYDPYKHVLQRVAVFNVQCRCCGFEPEDCVVAPRFCPKCHSQTWERFAKPGSILENAERD